jgi:hypothetical protein
MKPTPKLRFVERMEPITETTGRKVRVLQQWWVDEWLSGEWRDVPLEKENE